MPLVSVIIPTFNRAALIGQTLASVFAQTWRDYRIIVVDDGSTDDTPTLIGDDPRLAFIRIDHTGAGAARNAGIEIANGEFVAFLDSDDLWNPHFLERMVTSLRSHPEAGFAYCDYETFDEHGIIRPAYLEPHEKIGGSIFAALLADDYLCTGTLLIRRSCLGSTGGFDTELFPVEDWDMWLRLARSFDAVCLDESLVRIRMDPTHFSRDPSIVFSKNLRVLDKLRQQRGNGMQDHASAIRRQMMRFHLGLAMYYRSRRDLLSALKHGYLMMSARFS